MQFRYVFEFQNDTIDYRYIKDKKRSMLYEEILINNELLFNYDYSTKKGNYTGLKVLNPSLVLDFERLEERFLNYPSLAVEQSRLVINNMAQKGTIIAHTEGGVPNIVLELDDTTEFSVGYMIYFFEKACAVSGYLLGVNPFNQPGVESYKSNMFALLGKPGYEDKKAALEAKLG